jgi:hypothetical protein
MSMFVSKVSAYQQMQDWRMSQASMNSQVLGSSTAASTVDFSSAFADAANNYYSGIAVLGATAMGTRISQEQQSAAAKTPSTTTPGTTTPGTTTADAALSAAQAAGNLILSNLGIAGASSGGSAGASSSGQSTSGPYAAPINAATGYSYVQTSAADLNALNAINILA